MSEIIAKVGNVEITEEMVDAYIESLPEQQKAYASNPQFRIHCREQIIAMHCYAMLGEEMKLDETKEFKDIMESARKDILAQLATTALLKDITVTEEEAKKFYEENPQHFMQPENVRASHILVAEEDKCNDLLEKITAGEITFEDAAKEHSTCPSGQNGGDLGQFGRRQMVAEFDEAAFAAEVGHIVGPVKTQFGYHLIKVTEKNEASVAPYDQVAEIIHKNLLQEKQNKAYTKKAEELRAKYVK